METDSVFHRFLTDLKVGDADAAERLLRDYFERVVRFARAKIGPKYHAKADPEDVAASVIRTFFRRHQAGSFEQLSDAEQLWHLLARIASCKCCNRLRKFRHANGDRETPIPDDAAIAATLVADGDMVVLDLIARATLGFSEIEKQIVEMTLMDWEVAGIAGKFAISNRTVLRVRRRFAKQLEKLLKKADEL